MLQRFELTAVHQELAPQTRDYAVAKLAALDRYIPRHARESVRLEVRLAEARRRGRQLAVCEATLHLPRRSLSVREEGVTQTAAIDLMKTSLKQQIQKYKSEFTSGKHRRREFARLRPYRAGYLGSQFSTL